MSHIFRGILKKASLPSIKPTCLIWDGGGMNPRLIWDRGGMNPNAN